MPNLKDLRNRIHSIRLTKKVTKAMQVVSAARLQNMKSSVSECHDYTNLINSMLCDTIRCYRFHDLSVKKFLYNENKSTNATCILFTSDKGLCGNFNASIIKNLKLDIENFNRDNISTKLIVIGTKGVKDLQDTGYEKYINVAIEQTTNDFYATGFSITQKIMKMLESDSLGDCYLYFHQFKNSLTQSAIKKQVFPINEQIDEQSHNTSDTSIYETEGQALLDHLLYLYLLSQICYALIHSKASEHATRVIAMDNATRNAQKMIDNLTLLLNRTRQSMITTELIEIIAGAEAI